ncbi:hypothetical protein JCM21714_385 [Gracilibacillus boraciitolerans JCM 21714]|uniref:Allergen V5/Tpx-1 related n=1 Tax=Gracilibacillus boraciitolerans JCM 21714 TaxID=1298598 RepID=W4VE50_9BACI|nr:CAP domain-containing protein [Gracilibacillus boraciitolerans]GAE91436.1 hypothetical protein JCM21714_385 [Gracilibacillus boraciitolerans JCM 21714]
MPKLRSILFLLLIAGLVWFRYGDDYQQSGVGNVWQEMRSDVQTVKNSPIVSNAMETARVELKRLYRQIRGFAEDHTENTKLPQVESPKLDQPEEQTFSIHNIEIMDTKSTVESQLGDANRSTLNEYGVEWHTYHEQYRNFVMVAYNDDNHVIGLFTNQDLISSTNDISLGTEKSVVNQQLGEPLTAIKKGFVNYQINDNQEQDTYLLEDNYVTIFYDVHQNNTVAAIQIITKNLENKKKEYFASASDGLAEGLEYQLFDLTNAARAKFEKPLLDWHEPSRTTAQEHSQDMADENYFGHTNLEGQSPFDRLENDNIDFRMAGENLATGQPSSIFAHQGLMNSKGHRDNILHNDFRLMSVGVAFNQQAQPFYTEAYLTK